MQKPKFFIVGKPKSGTTALFEFLKQHPSIFLPQFKEPHYFANLNYLPEKLKSRYPLTEKEYLTLFSEAKAEQICGEASTGYLYSSVAAQNIHAFAPDAKIIIIIREPIDFLQSLHLQLLKNRYGETVKDFQKAFALESTRKKGKNIPSQCILPEGLYYSERVKYRDQIKRFYKYFSKEQIKIIIYDDWKKDNVKIYQDILAFLEVDPTFIPIISNYNKGRKVARFKKIIDFSSDLRQNSKYWKIVNQLITLIFPEEELRLKSLSFVKDNLLYSSVKPVNAQFKAELKQAFKPEVIALSNLINKDLISLWDY